MKVNKGGLAKRLLNAHDHDDPANADSTKGESNGYAGKNQHNHDSETEIAYDNMLHFTLLRFLQ